MRLAVVADVVIAYFNLSGTQDQLAIAERTLASRKRALELEEIRYEGGEVDALAVHQARAQLETTRAQVPGLRERMRLQESVLGSLVGLSPAEAEVMAATAEIGAAEADRLPRLNLMGFLGTSATSTGDLFSTSSETWGLGASVSRPWVEAGSPT